MNNINKCYILIDGNYLRMESKKLFGKLRYDFNIFITNVIQYVQNEIQRNLSLIRTYYYDAPPLLDKDQLNSYELEFAKKRQKFLDRLQRLKQFEVVLGRIQYKGRDENGKLILTQKGVDVKMAIDLISFSEKSDVVILITGDNDLVPAIEMAKTKSNANIILLYFENKKSRLLDELIKTADISLPIKRELFSTNSY